MVVGIVFPIQIELCYSHEVPQSAMSTHRSASKGRSDDLSALLTIWMTLIASRTRHLAADARAVFGRRKPAAHDRSLAFVRTLGSNAAWLDYFKQWANAA